MELRSNRAAELAAQYLAALIQDIQDKFYYHCVMFLLN